MSELNIIERDEFGFEVCVWLEPEGGDEDGLCIGVGSTRTEALHDAEVDLLTALDAVRAELAKAPVPEKAT